jgi:hypothetical protein
MKTVWMRAIMMVSAFVVILAFAQWMGYASWTRGSRALVTFPMMVAILLVYGLVPKKEGE